MDHQLELKQIVDYQRCRIYHEFIRSLMEDRDIRTNGSSYLVGPGEWICKTSELTEWFRTRFQHQALSILEFLQKQNYITFTRLGRNNLIKFSIIDWRQHNTALEDCAPTENSL